ncbi:hypothetical protein CsSME_00053098 [Camellia sinensis var. sinensis]
MRESLLCTTTRWGVHVSKSRADFWVLDLKTNQWEQLNYKGCPSPRSGHRMWFVSNFCVFV